MPRAVTPGELSAILRSDDDGPDALYPCRIGVFCDACHAVEERDFLVNDRTSKPERLELIRAFACTLGWSINAYGDWCPPCVAAGKAEG
jgi:hypothetical protein